MATSGSVNYSRTANQIISLAFRLVGVGTQGEALEAEEQEDGLERLNLMVKSWQAEKIHLWKKKDAVLFTTASQHTYSIGPTGNRAATTWAETTLSADAASGASTISVTSITSMASADVLGILLDDNTMQWTTINGAPSGSTVTPAVVLTGAASSGNKVFAYAALMNRPLRILDMQRRDDNDTDVEVMPIARDDYRNLPNKTATGTPVQYYYDPQQTNGKLSLWLAPSDERYTMRFTAALPIEDFDQATDDPDFPVEWIEAIAYNLAQRLISSYGDTLSQMDRMELATQAGLLKETLRQWDQDTDSMTFEPYADWSR